MDEGGSLKHYTPVSLAVIEQAQMTPVHQSIDTVYPNKDTSQNTALLLQMVEAIAGNQQQSPLWYHRELEEAAEVGWLLTTKEVRALIGVKPHGPEYRRGCWLFVKMGRIGNQSAWTVEKIS